MNSLIITRTTNGYILDLVGPDSEPLDRAIATDDNTHGYSRHDLCQAIETIFDRNTAKESAPAEAEADADSGV